MSESETQEAPRRLVSADHIRMQHEALIAALTRTAEPHVAVEFTRNAKGDTQINTKVTSPAGVGKDKLDTLAASVLDEAVQLYTDACAKFPMPDGYVRAK